MKPTRILFMVFLIVCSIASVGCVRRSTPPGPDMAAGVYINAGYEYFTWDEGLKLMLWHDAIQTSSCDSSGSTRDPEHHVQCSAVSSQGQSFAWQITTSDGIQAAFSIDDSLFDLAGGNVFLVTTTDGSTEIQQIQRDLTDVSDEDLIDFSLGDPVIGPFIETLNSE